MATVDIRFEIVSWDEKTLQDLPSGQRLVQADVPLSVAAPGIAAKARMTSLMHYLEDGTSTYSAVLTVDGSLDGRTGSFVLLGTGTFDGTRARVEFSVVAGSGTGELAGIQGTATSESTHADYPHMPLHLDYQLG